ncbi:MAG: GNAT family N-acetyltransferase [Planctomycetaceae bacterium]|nr:GNAT family N-acetyltransferase [Planctomycetota bacterium]NUN52934.1 GNAT family N-acetyltransferase [Planctomycetaceae bacterium]
MDRASPDPAAIGIRPLLPSDSLEELTDLLHRAYAELGAMGFNYTAVDQDAAATARRIEGNHCLVAVEGGRLVGTVTLSPRWPKPLPPWREGLRTAFLNQLAVDPGRRGIGLGARLMEAAEGRARELGFPSVSLDTAEGAVHLVRLYEGRGYRAVGFHSWPGKTYRSVVLEKRF